jgi:hypothetical protein
MMSLALLQTMLNVTMSIGGHAGKLTDMTPAAAAAAAVAATKGDPDELDGGESALTAVGRNCVDATWSIFTGI